MGRVKGLRPEDTRRRVIDGAADAFAELGYEGARVTDIAKAAGLSSGAMYNHFESKAELLAAVVENHACSQLLAWADGDGSVGLLDLILQYGKAMGASTQLDAPLLIEAAAAARRDPAVLSVLAEQVGVREDLFTQFIEAAQAGGEVAAGIDAHAAARFMFMVLLGSALVQAMDLPPVRPAAWDALLGRVLGAFKTGE